MSDEGISYKQTVSQLITWIHLNTFAGTRGSGLDKGANDFKLVDFGRETMCIHNL